MRYLTYCILFLFAAIIAFYSRPALAAPPLQIYAAQAGLYEDADRLVLHLSASAPYSVFTLTGPDRLVIDLPSADWSKAGALSIFKGNRTATQVRYGNPKPGSSRVVLDLNQPVTVLQHMILPPQTGEFYRLVVDLAPKHHAATTVSPPPIPDISPSEPIPSSPSAFIPTPTPSPVGSASETVPMPVLKPSLARAEAQKVRIITIDPGHGGVDPGTVSTSGTYEKEITLAYAKALQKALALTGRYQAKLTRSDDIFLKLRHRVAIGRENRSDLFLSLHADSAPSQQAQGVSVYTLSEQASDKEAGLLAQQENKADILADIDLTTEDENVAEILIDLAQRETKNTSSRFAEILSEELQKDVKLVSNSHRFAGFAVLKAPDVPSVLVELGFLSNPKDEGLLKSSSHRQKVIQAVIRAIDRFFAEHPNL